MTLDSSVFSPLAPEFQADPYPFYAMLRANAPILFYSEWNSWFILAHDDCVNLMRHPSTGREILNVMTREELGWTSETPAKYQHVVNLRNGWLLFRDPPDHTRLRGLVHKAFTPRVVERLRDRIQKLTDDLIDAAIAKGGMDIMTDFATPLPVAVIAELLGVPPMDHDRFRRWSRDLASTLEIQGSMEVWDRAVPAAKEYDEYLRELAAERRARPQDDLITALVQVEDSGDTLTEDELVSTCTLLLTAGHETTVNLIGNGLHAALTHPDQWAALTGATGEDRQAVIKGAVEEFLRYDSPVQMTTRWIMEDMEFQGHTFNKGQDVALIFGAANRDPERFDDPDRLDVRRDNAGKHLAFGSGIHFCLGAPLARLEGQIAFETLSRRLPGMSLAADPVRRPAYILRGFESMPVTIR
jgi:cytochrome P450